MLRSKPVLCIDFDGVIHSYSSGWKSADVITDPPVPGAIEALLHYTEHFTVCIHSSRFNLVNLSSRPPMEAVKNWLYFYGIPILQILSDADLLVNEPPDGIILLCATKPPALMTIDDRAITFNGVWPEVDTILKFRPWNKQEI